MLSRAPAWTPPVRRYYLWLTTGAVLHATTPVNAHAQARGIPAFFEPADAYDTRIGVDVGHGGELGGFTLVASGSRHIMLGNCRRASVAFASGIWNQSGPTGARLTTAVGAQVLLNPCPSPLSVSSLTFRALAGIQLIHGQGTSSWSVPLGVGAGWKLPFPGIKLEPWVVPALTWSEETAGVSNPGWHAGFSTGLTVGWGATVGLRAGLECCRGGVAGGYGLSFWF